MTIRRLCLCFLAALLCEVAVFAVSYQDLLFLGQPLDRLRNARIETLAAHADVALSRTRVTRRHLEIIAAVAGERQLSDLEVRALERMSTDAPDDASVRLRLADALRRTGQLDRAERLYLAVLASTPTGAP